MHNPPSLRPLLLALPLLASPGVAAACGGFFCNPVIEPVVQTAERVLFTVHDDGTITSTIEIQFEGEPTDFAWVLPLPEPIDPEAVRTAPAGLFDALEELTAPRFVTASQAGYAADLSYAGGCSCAGSDDWGGTAGFGAFDVSGVQVVGASVVGPYATEVITAEEPANLLNWLQLNGYQIPSAAQEPIANYVSSGASFLGVKLSPSVPAGPMDALSLRFTAATPSLPLMLTSVAAVADMDITTYVLAETRYTPSNYVEQPFGWTDVRWAAGGGTDYLSRLPVAMDAAGGRAFVAEFAGRVDGLALVEPSGNRESQTPEQAAAALLRQGSYLSRFRTVLSPEEMTLDPSWVPAPSQPDVSNQHVLADPTSVAGLPLWLLGLGALLGARRRVKGGARPRHPRTGAR